MTSHRGASFDRIAPFYRAMEYATFFRELERCRFALLPALGQPRRALLYGDGDGRFLARLVATHPQLSADAVDSSAAMLKRARSRVERLRPTAGAQIRFHLCDALAFCPHGSYDLVVTHFFLDCLTEQEVAALLRQVTPHLAPGAFWLISEFAVPAKQPAGWLARLVIAALYRAFRLLTGLRTQRLPNYASLLRSAGFECNARSAPGSPAFSAASCGPTATVADRQRRPSPRPHTRMITIQHGLSSVSSAPLLYAGGYPGEAPDVVPEPGFPTPGPGPEPDSPGFPEPDPDPAPFDPLPTPAPVTLQ